MSFLSGLFGGNKRMPVAPPPPPRVGDIAGEAAAREQRYRSKKKYGVDDTMLGSGAAGTSSGVANPGRTMLG